MRKSLVALSALMVLSGASSAFAASGCQGDFLSVNGGWIADPNCERNVAERVAAKYGEHIVSNPSAYNQESRAQFCRGNDNIATDVYCAPYKD